MGDGVDELDIALLDALHLNPLASFEELGTVLDVSPVTAARRWRRLVATGRAWVSSAPGRELPLKAALFEAECQPGAASAVADEFAAIPQVFSVNITTGQDNLYAFVVAADQPLLAKLIVDKLPTIAGLNRVQSGLMTQCSSPCSCTMYPTWNRWSSDCQPNNTASRCSTPAWYCARSSPGDGYSGSTAAHKTSSPWISGRRSSESCAGFRFLQSQ